MRQRAIALSESDVKKAVSDYLQLGQNQEKWLYIRLNSGSFILSNGEGNFRRRVQGAQKGTADFVVFQGVEHSVNYQGQRYKPIVPMLSCRVTFIEIKSSKGKTTKKQDEFREQVEKLHCRYYVVRSVEDVVDIIK